MNAEEANKQINYLVDDLQDRAYVAPVFDFIREQAARIAELEDKLRWRDCKTEPPKETGYYLARWNHERLPEVSGVFFNSGMRHGWRVLHLTRQPDSWRPIE